MMIFIPTLGREGNQKTLEAIPDRWKEYTYLVAPEEQPDHQTKICQEKGIAKTRQWIVENSPDDFPFMLDDDLKFFKRKDSKLKKASPNEVGEFFDLMQEWLQQDSVPFAGATARFGNNWINGDYVDNYRSAMNYGFDRRIFLEHDIRFDDLEVCEDYYVMLHLLRRGYFTRMTAVYCVESGAVNKNGGCALYRDEEMVKRSMEKFVDTHYPYANYRKTKGHTQGFDIGTELRIQWKKAAEDKDLLNKGELFS